MKLKDFELVASTDYVVYVNSQGKRIDRFDSDEQEKLEKYQDAEIGSIDIFNEDILLVRVEW